MTAARGLLSSFCAAQTQRTPGRWAQDCPAKAPQRGNNDRGARPAPHNAKHPPRLGGAIPPAGGVEGAASEAQRGEAQAAPQKPALAVDGPVQRPEPEHPRARATTRGACGITRGAQRGEMVEGARPAPRACAMPSFLRRSPARGEAANRGPLKNTLPRNGGRSDSLNDGGETAGR